MFDIRVFHHRRTCICFHCFFFTNNFVLFFHGNADQRKKHCNSFVLGRKRNPCFEVLIYPNWVVRSRQLGKLTVLTNTLIN